MEQRGRERSPILKIPVFQHSSIPLFHHSCPYGTTVIAVYQESNAMKTKDAFLGLDLGGTGAKAGVFDHSGKMLGFEQCGYDPIVDDHGRVEISIEDIYEAARGCVRRAVGASGASISAMSISSQGETFVSLDERDRPLHRAIVWYDSRACDQSERLKKLYIEARARSEHDADAEAGDSGGGEKREFSPHFDPMCSGPKIMWLKDHFPELMKRARRFLLLPDYIAYRLTGLAVTDSNTAASTSLYAEGSSDFDSIALAVAGIAREQLAEVFHPGDPAGEILPGMVEEWGLNPGVLFVAGTNDQYAGALGAGNYRPGILSETTGTCLALVTLTKDLPDPLPGGLFGGRFPISEFKFALAYSKTAGVVLDWFMRECCRGAAIGELNAEAERVPIGCRGLTMIPHFDGMISPQPDPDARGAFVNLTLQHTRADMFRAILEALSFSLKENIDFLGRHGLRIETVRSIGGGAKNDMWLQMKADITGMPIERPAVTEAAVLGAAMLAACGHGDFNSLAESSRSLYQSQRVFNPDPARSAAYEEPFKKYLRLVKQLSAVKRISTATVGY